MIKKIEQVQILLPRVPNSFSDAKKILKKMSQWTDEIIQFICLISDPDGQDGEVKF